MRSAGSTDDKLGLEKDAPRLGIRSALAAATAPRAIRFLMYSRSSSWLPLVEHRKKFGISLFLCIALAFTLSAADKVVLTWWTWSIPTVEDFVMIKKGFEAKYPNIELESSVNQMDDYKAKPQAEFSSGAGPDIFSMQPGPLLSQYKAFALDLTKIAQPTLDKLVPAVVADAKARSGGDMIAIAPLGSAATPFIYCNATYFQKAGIKKLVDEGVIDANSIGMWADGKACMHINGGWAIGMLSNPKNVNAEGKPYADRRGGRATDNDVFGAFPMPNFAGGAPVVLGGFFTAWLRVYTPISRPAMVNVIVLGFINSWNDYLNPLLFSRTENMRTLPMAVVSLQASIYGARPEVVYACLVIMAVPSVVVYLFLQDQLGEGMTAGAVKG